MLSHFGLPSKPTFPESDNVPLIEFVTYSPAITLVPTYECFNRCSYCNFRVNPQEDEWLSLTQARERLLNARSRGAIEVLVLSGEVHPQSARRIMWIEHIYSICTLALEVGLLPHTNVGPLSEVEMSYLRGVNVSMGLMVEQVTPALLKNVHQHAPSKIPEIRLQQMEQAGRLQIPFTTGLLLGIGESVCDRIDTLRAIAASHDRWGHIQEVILQPHQPGIGQSEAMKAFSPLALAQFVKIARQYLPKEIVLQVPPNLITSPQHMLKALDNGARDLGGLGPVDEVNPDYPHPTVPFLNKLLASTQWQLQPRLPIYSQYDSWLAEPLQRQVSLWRQSLEQAKL